MVNLICFFITAEFTLFSCLFYSPLIQNSRFQKLFDRGLKLVTKVKKGMKNALISLNEKILLRKRSIIETVFGYLKNRLEIEHTRHRSPVNFLVHIFSTLISYSIKSKKPSISYTFFLP